MRLTKLQRYTAYVIMAQEIGGKDTQSQFCHLIFKLFGINNDGYFDDWKGDWWLQIDGGGSINYVLDFFPELKKKKPYGGWPHSNAEGIYLRKIWLDQCIEETHP